MASRRTNASNPVETNRPPATTPEERENQLISAAVNLAEQQLRSGEASAQVITHYLKLGSSREKLEQKRLENEVALLQTKREMMESEKRVETLISEALHAMQAYSGHSIPDEENSFDDYEG
jgi:hypothetical protein